MIVINKDNYIKIIKNYTKTMDDLPALIILIVILLVGFLQSLEKCRGVLFNER